jgi:site-specific recombinase XerD
VPELRRERIKAIITEPLGKWTPATAHSRHLALRSFFCWLLEEGEIVDSPMARMKPPRGRTDS